MGGGTCLLRKPLPDKLLVEVGNVKISYPGFKTPPVFRGIPARGGIPTAYFFLLFEGELVKLLAGCANRLNHDYRKEGKRKSE